MGEAENDLIWWWMSFNDTVEQNVCMYTNNTTLMDSTFLVPDTYLSSAYDYYVSTCSIDNAIIWD